MTAAEYFDKGLASLYEGDYEAALDALSQAIRLDPGFGADAKMLQPVHGC